MIYRRGEMWWYKFQFAGRLFQESARTTTKALARQIERKRHQQLEESLHGIKKRVAPKQFAVIAAEWLEAKQPSWSDNTFSAAGINVRHLLAHFGGLLLIDITAEDIAAYQKRRLKDGAAPKTINHEVGTLRAILVRNRLWAALQPDVTMLRVDDEVGKALSKDEESRLLEACAASRSHVLLPLVILALYTGMRRGEVQGLRWKQINFLDRTVTVGESKTSAGSGRVIPLNERALQTLQSWASNFSNREFHHAVFPNLGTGRKRLASSINPEKPIGTIKTAWQSAKYEAGVECRFHDLRHTFCTRLLERGASLSVVSAIMGWSASTTAMMAKRYGHIGAEAQRKALDSLVEEPTEPRSWSDSLSLASRS